MADINLLFDGQVAGTTATTANTGFSVLQQPSGGLITFDDDKSFSGSGGLRFTTGTSTAYGRLPFTTATSSARVSVGLTMPNQTQTATISLLGGFGAGDVAVFALCWLATGQIVLRKTSGTSTGQLSVANAGVIPLSARVRVEMQQIIVNGTTSTVDVKLYDRNTMTVLASANSTAFDMGSAPLTYVNVGVASSGAVAGTTVGVDNLLISDTSGSALGPYWPPAVTTGAKAERLSTNGGGWAIVGGSFSFPVALNDGVDTTYVQSPGAASNEVFQVRVGELTPGDQRWTLKIGAAASGGQQKWELVQEDSTVIATRTYDTTTTVTTVQFVLTTPENNAITNRKGMLWRVTSNPA